MNRTFPKKEHLKRKKLIDLLFKQGQKVSAYPLLLFYTQAPLFEDVVIQAGFSVAKRNHKLAVTRNRLKRLMREVYRKNKLSFQTNELTFAFMFIYTGREEVSYIELEKAMLKLISKFNSKVSAGPEDN